MTDRVIQGDFLFAQTDYRSILREGYSLRKQRKQGFSYLAWARKLGLRSPATLAMILNGQRHPGPSLVRKLTQDLQFSAAETQYFEDLVALQKNRGKDIQATVALVERIRKRRHHSGFRFVEFETLESISNWYYVAIREMVGLADFREDPFWICERLHFKITPKEAAQAIRRLLALKLLTRENGRLVASDSEVDIGSDIKNLAVQKLHQQSIDLSREALAKVATKDREFQITTLVMDSADLEECKKWIRKFHDDFCDRFERRGGNHLYQVNLCLYPMTREIA
jgi:uncharacterized protein (TIGR02147 family)